MLKMTPPPALWQSTPAPPSMRPAPRWHAQEQLQESLETGYRKLKMSSSEPARFTLVRPGSEPQLEESEEPAGQSVRRALELEEQRDEAKRCCEKAQQTVQAMKEQLSCGVCLLLLSWPVTLGCGHSFCSSCMAQWETATAGSSRPLTCPGCRAAVGLVTPGRVLDDMCCAIGDAAAMRRRLEQEPAHRRHEARWQKLRNRVAVTLAQKRQGAASQPRARSVDGQQQRASAQEADPPSVLTSAVAGGLPLLSARVPETSPSAAEVPAIGQALEEVRSDPPRAPQPRRLPFPMSSTVSPSTSQLELRAPPRCPPPSRPVRGRQSAQAVGSRRGDVEE